MHSGLRICLEGNKKFPTQMDVVTTSRRRLHGRETQAKRGCHVIYGPRHRKLKHVPQSEYTGRHSRFFAVVLISFDPPPRYYMLGCPRFHAFLLVFLLCVAFLCKLTGVWVLEPKKTTAKSVGLFRYMPSTRVVIGEVSHKMTYTRCTAHTALPDRTLCPPVPIVLMPNLQMDLDCKVSLIRRFLLRPGLIFRDGIAYWHGA
jgi:hypothetical protein